VGRECRRLIAFASFRVPVSIRSLSGQSRHQVAAKQAGSVEALAMLQAEGEIAELSKAAGLIYLPPRNPAILGEIWHEIIQK
jgi:hypothetical protein